MDKEEVMKKTSQQEIDWTVVKFQTALGKRDLTTARGILLYLNLLIQNAPVEHPRLNYDGVIRGVLIKIVLL
jgi:hypothetical protein